MALSLQELIKPILDRLEKLNDVREHIIKSSREVLRLNRELLLKIHKGKIDDAWKLFDKLKSMVKELIETCKNYPELYYGGLLTSVLVEYVETSQLLYIVTYGRYATHEELGVNHVAYLLGLCDVVGELRRLILDLLKRGDIDQAEKYFKFMEDIYETLSLIVLPDAITMGLRSKVDSVRKLVEVTRSDILMFYLKRK